MAVYERRYRPYSGPLTPQRTRFLVLPHYAYRAVLRSRLFVAFLAACMLWPLTLAVLIYLPHNISFIETFQLEAGSILSFFQYDEWFFFRWVLLPLNTVAFLVAFVLGPALISADLNNNGLPLYLSRPFSRSEYLLGKSSVMLILLSLVTWVPGSLLFGLQASLAGGDWLREHWRIGPAIVLSSALWILILCLISLALSAYVKWKPAARAALIGVFVVLPALSVVVNVLLATDWGRVIDVGAMMGVAAAALFSQPSPVELPLWAAVASLATSCVGCLWLLARKVRAYEVVR